MQAQFSDHFKCVQAIDEIVQSWRETRDDMSAKNAAANAAQTADATSIQDFVRPLNAASTRLARLLGVQSAAEAEAFAEVVANMRGGVFGDGV